MAPNLGGAKSTEYFCVSFAFPTTQGRNSSDVARVPETMSPARQDQGKLDPKRTNFMSPRKLR